MLEEIVRHKCGFGTAVFRRKRQEPTFRNHFGSRLLRGRFSAARSLSTPGGFAACDSSRDRAAGEDGSAKPDCPPDCAARGDTVTAFHDHGLANRWFARMEASLLRPALPAASAPVGAPQAPSRMGDTTAPNSGDEIEFHDESLPVSCT